MYDLERLYYFTKRKINFVTETAIVEFCVYLDAESES